MWGAFGREIKVSLIALGKEIELLNCHKAAPGSSRVERMNRYHYYKVRAEREKRGLEVKPLNLEIKNHYMLNKTLFSKVDQQEYRVFKVLKQWIGGWIITLILLDKNNSSKIAYWENISSIDKDILMYIAYYQKEFNTGE